MKAIEFEEFISLFPHLPRAGVEAVYARPFYPHDILEYFEQWEYDEACHCYIDNSEERNMLWFEEEHYFINAGKRNRPLTLNDFIKDCRATGVILFWNETTADRLFFIYQ